MTLHYFGDEPARTEGPVIRGNVGLYPQPLELSHAENVVFAFAAYEQPDLRRSGQFFCQVVQRSQADTASYEDFFLARATMGEAATQRSQNIKMIGMMKRRQHGGAPADHAVEHVHVGLLASARIFGGQDPEVENSEGTPEQGIDRLPDFHHHELARQRGKHFAWYRKAHFKVSGGKFIVGNNH